MTTLDDNVSAEDTDALQDLVVEEVSGGTGARGKRVRIKLHDKTKALTDFIKLKMDMEQRERERQALEAKTIDGTAERDDEADWLADLGRRYHLKSLEQRKGDPVPAGNGKTTGDGHARNGSGRDRDGNGS